MKNLKDAELVERLRELMTLERKTKSEILQVISEIDRRRLYLDLGYANLFLFLTESMGYSAGSAQRRIESARLMHKIPEIKKDLDSGALNMSQVSMVAQALRQSPDRTAADALVVCQQIQNMGIQDSQRAIAQSFDLEIKTYESVRIQKDSSMRADLTFTAEQSANLRRVKELMSHSHPSANWSEVIDQLAEFYLKHKDPLRPKRTDRKIGADCVKSAATTIENSTLPTRGQPVTNPSAQPSTSNLEVKLKHRFISASVRRQVFQRDQCCQWVDGKTQRRCKSNFQLQIDHRQSVWAGGESVIENLQLLCAVHNRLKYQREAGISVSRSGFY